MSMLRLPHWIISREEAFQLIQGYLEDGLSPEVLPALSWAFFHHVELRRGRGDPPRPERVPVHLQIVGDDPGVAVLVRLVEEEIKPAKLLVQLLQEIHKRRAVERLILSEELRPVDAYGSEHDGLGVRSGCDADRSYVRGGPDSLRLDVLDEDGFVLEYYREPLRDVSEEPGGPFLKASLFSREALWANLFSGTTGRIPHVWRSL